MSIEPIKFARRPFYVDAIQVTAENMADVAEWCSGTVIPQTAERGAHIHVRVFRPMNENQSRAFIGDWLLYAGSGYKVYTTKAFGESFEEIDEEPCGRTELTLDHKPCVLGKAHLNGLILLGCRSRGDYAIMVQQAIERVEKFEALGMKRANKDRPSDHFRPTETD